MVVKGSEAFTSWKVSTSLFSEENGFPCRSNEGPHFFQRFGTTGIEMIARMAVHNWTQGGGMDHGLSAKE